MKVIYIANDGKQFYDEEVCRRYERELTIKNSAGLISGLNENGEKISFSDSDFCDKAFVISLTTNEAAEIFVDRCDNEGFSAAGIEGEGIYLWNDGGWDAELCCWNLVSDIIDDYKNNVKCLQGFIDAFDK